MRARGARRRAAGARALASALRLAVRARRLDRRGARAPSTPPTLTLTPTPDPLTLTLTLPPNQVTNDPAGLPAPPGSPPPSPPPSPRGSDGSDSEEEEVADPSDTGADEVATQFVDGYVGRVRDLVEPSDLAHEMLGAEMEAHLVLYGSVVHQTWESMRQPVYDVESFNTTAPLPSSGCSCHTSTRPTSNPTPTSHHFSPT